VNKRGNIDEEDRQFFDSNPDVRRMVLESEYFLFLSFMLDYMFVLFLFYLCFFCSLVAAHMESLERIQVSVT
jgi:hypothetical protein